MARNFNGGTDQIYYADPNVPSNAGCVALWLKTTQTTVGTTPFSYWTSSSRSGFGLILNSTANKISFQGYDISASRVLISSTSSVNGGGWKHVLVNYNRVNGGANEMFIDGASEASANSSAAWTVGSGGFWNCCGDNPDPFWPSFVGDMAEVAHWTTNLDAAELAALAQGFSPRLIRPASLRLYAPLLRETRPWRNLDSYIGVTGTTVTDHPRILGGGI